MKILLVSHFFPPKHTAGTEKRTLGYAVELLKLGYEVQVVCAGEWETGNRYWNGFRDEVYQDVPVRRIDLNWALAPNPNQYLYDNPLIEQYFDQWLVQWNPDIVHITSCLTLSASVIRASKKKNLPVVFTLTDFWSICPKINLVRYDQTLCDGQTTAAQCLHCIMQGTKIYQGLKSVFPEKAAISILDVMSRFPVVAAKRGMRGMLLNMSERIAVLSEVIDTVDRVTAPSAFLADIIQKSGKIHKPIQVIYSGHDLSWLANMPLKKSSEKIRFGFIGQIIPVKGLHLLVSAFLQAGIEEKAQLLIYGDLNTQPEYTATLKALTGDHHDIEFMGTFSHDRLGNVLSKMDVLVVPSQWHENNPRVMQEAFASKTPVIASNVGGISEFVQHEVNGLLFKYDCTDELAQMLQKLVFDTGLVKRLQGGIRSPRTIGNEVNDLVEVYLALLSDSKKEL